MTAKYDLYTPNDINQRITIREHGQVDLGTLLQRIGMKDPGYCSAANVKLMKGYLPYAGDRALSKTPSFCQNYICAFSPDGILFLGLSYNADHHSFDESWYSLNGKNGFLPAFDIRYAQLAHDPSSHAPALEISTAQKCLFSIMMPGVQYDFKLLIEHWIANNHWFAVSHNLFDLDDDPTFAGSPKSLIIYEELNHLPVAPDSRQVMSIETHCTNGADSDFQKILNSSINSSADYLTQTSKEGLLLFRLQQGDRLPFIVQHYLLPWIAVKHRALCGDEYILITDHSVIQIQHPEKTDLHLSHLTLHQNVLNKYIARDQCHFIPEKQLRKYIMEQSQDLTVNGATLLQNNKLPQIDWQAPLKYGAKYVKPAAAALAVLFIFGVFVPVIMKLFIPFCIAGYIALAAWMTYLNTELSSDDVARKCTLWCSIVFGVYAAVIIL